MSHLKTETVRVMAILDEIAANPAIFAKLGNAKIEAAIMVYQSNSIENLAHSVEELTKTIKMVLKRVNDKALKVLFQEGEDSE